MQHLIISESLLPRRADFSPPPESAFSCVVFKNVDAISQFSSHPRKEPMYDQSFLREEPGKEFHFTGGITRLLE